MDEYFEYFHQLNKQIHNLSKKQYDEIEEFLGDMEQSVPTLKEYLIEVCDAINDGSSLGIYSSEERAKEVLRELIEAVSIKEIEGSYKELEIIIKLKSFVAYEMPEK